jgi:TPR repeat protein
MCRLLLFVLVLVVLASCSDRNQITDLDFDQSGNLYEAVMSDLESELERDFCEQPNLLSLSDASHLSDEELSWWNDTLKVKNGDALARVAFDYAMESPHDEALTNRGLMYLLQRSAEQGSALGLNEVGASLMYCYQNVRNDDLQAAEWFNKAIEKGSTMAMRSLATLHLEGRLGVDSSRSEGLRLLRRCASVGRQECSADLDLYEGSQNSGVK